MAFTWLGIIGLLFVVGSWLPQIKKLLQEKHSGLSIPFALLYLIGSLLLTLHALLIEDMVFMVLNGSLTLLASISLYYTLKYRE